MQNSGIRRLTCASMVLLGLAVGQAQAQTPSFGVGVTYPTSEDTTAIAVADINHDNHLDLVVAACDNNLIRVRLGDGLGGFGVEHDFPTGDGMGTGLLPSGIAIADFNGDTHPDVATVNALSDDVSILLGDGLGGFGAPLSVAVGSGPFAIVAADFNKDSKIDLAATSEDGKLTVMLGLGDGAFAHAAGSPLSVGPFSVDVAVGDVNNDTNLDLAVVSQVFDQVWVFLGDGTGAFALSPAAVNTSPGPTGVELGDLNGDGFLDLVVAASNANLLQIFPGVGDGTFAPLGTSVPTATNPHDPSIGDFTGDGLLDVAVVLPFNDQVQVLAGDGAGSVAPPVDIPTTGETPIFLTAGDFNEDHKLDLAVAHVITQDSEILLNETCCLVSVTRAGTGTGTVTSNPSRVNCGPGCFQAFPSGAPVTLTATAAPGSLFAGWSGACTGMGPCTFSPTTDAAVTATFDVLALSPASFPAGVVGTLYFEIVTMNGAAPIAFTLESGTLPPGLTLGEDGSLAGFPFSVGVYPFTLRGTDLDGRTATGAYAITIAPGATSTSPADSEATYDQNSQEVALLASVSNPVVVGSGTVTFTVRDASTAIVGVPVTAPVSDEISAAVFVLPAGTSAQVLTITAVYNGTADFLTSSGTSALTVNAASSTTAAANAAAAFNEAAQSVPLSATVTSPAGTVNGGTVTFTARDSTSAIVGAPTPSAAVSGGAAGVSYTLPAGLAPQTLTITADYDGSTNFAASTDATHTLTIGAAPSATAAANATATFNAAGQAVPLSATVTSPNGTVNAGTVTFTVRDATSAIVGLATTSATVSAGTANVSYAIPGGTPGQTLTITAVYNGSTNFTTSTDAAHTLIIGAASSVIAAANASATFSTASQSVPLSATVTSPNGTVNGGIVTFTVRDSTSAIVGVATASGPVSGGTASANYTLPGGTNAQTLTITAVYNGSANFATSTDAVHTLTLGSATTSTVATGGSVPPNVSAQIVPLTATVASGAGTVGAGTVTFTARTAGNVVIGASVTRPVVGGIARATYMLPGGTPVQTLTITAAYGGTGNFSASTGTAALSIACPAVIILPASLTSVRLGVPFSRGFGVGPIATYTQTGTLPPGLTFSNGDLFGTPTALGRFDFTVTATVTGSGCTGSQPYTVNVMRAPNFLTAAGGGTPRVRAFAGLGPHGVNAITRDFLADDASFAGGIRVATGDVTGDSVDDIITAPGHDSASAIVRVFDGVTGAQVRQFEAYPYSSPGGTYVAAGDVNADGVADIITGRDGSPPEVRVFDGPTGQLISAFLAYPPSLVGGVRVAAGDLNGDGLAEIITAPDAGAAPEVRVFTGGGVLAASFMAYDPAFTAGVYVAAGDVDGDGLADIVTGAGAGGGPHVRVYSGADLHELRGFFAYAPFFTGGVRVAVGDLDLDGYAEIITAPGAGGGPHVRVWDGATGVEATGFFAYDPSFTDGVFVAAPAPQSRMSVDTPARGETVPGVFLIGGWAVQGSLTDDNGVDAIHAWAYPVAGGSPIFVGATATGGPRPDVAAVLGGSSTDAGFTMIGALPAGTYDLVVFARNARSGIFADRRVVRIVVTP